MSASTDLTRSLAGLARLELPEAEAAVLAEQLDQILGYIRTLQDLDVTEVPEYLTADQPHSGLRDDVPGPHLEVEAALAGAPARSGDQIAVPKFMADE